MQSPARIRRIKIKVPDEIEAALHAADEPVRVPLETMVWRLVPPPHPRYSYRPHLRQGRASGGALGDVLYLFGGFEDNGQRSNRVVTYDVESREWATVECSGKMPAPRYGHACAIRPEARELWLFGGQGPEEGLNAKNIFDDLSILDLSTRMWRRGVVSCAGADGHVNFVPQARRGHSLVLYKEMLYVFGGSGLDRMTNKDEYFGDLQRLDLATLCWYEPAMTGTIPEPRSHHSALMVAKYMIVFGGQTTRTKLPSPERARNSITPEAPDTGLTSNNVYALDVESCHWHVVAPLDGTPPAPRYGHVMQAHPSNGLCLFLFGGKTSHGYDDGQIHCLDLELKRWSSLTCLEPIPPRIRHVFSLLKNEMMIFGGCGDNGLCIGDVFRIEIPELPSPASLDLFSEPPKDDSARQPAAPTAPRPHTIGGFMGFKSFQFTPARPEVTKSCIRVSPIKVAKPPAVTKPWTPVVL
ncbi:RING finger protein B-like isoform X1 [Achlya hypogyna]|uniref:RING finger protein B-like isoform X1 n=1 Tax=Achlya hypogyna TaxID=1202772 RepID=A0A1V9YLX8_ACHHY|nr:RING finger protein B-like isoform X1 [Achlya hypogyna]